MSHEQEFIKAFILPPKQARYLSLLESRKGRGKILDRLDHLDDLDVRFATLVPTNKQTVTDIERLLTQKGAPAICHILSSNSSIDDRDMSLCEALGETVGQGMGSIISCIPGRLAYYESEEPGLRYILARLRL